MCNQRSCAPARPGISTSPTFKTGVDLVALNVVVTDRNQQFITGLTADHFAVYEDGVQQDISYFAASSVPLGLALLIDTSASMSDKMATMQEAAIGFASTLRPGDRLTIVDIKDGVRIVHPLDENIDSAKDAIRATTAGGGTALFNGLYLTIKGIAKLWRTNGDVRRQAIAVLTDGDDTASLIAFEDVNGAGQPVRDWLHIEEPAPRRHVPARRRASAGVARPANEDANRIHRPACRAHGGDTRLHRSDCIVTPSPGRTLA